MILKKWWFWLVVLVLLIALALTAYYILGMLGVIPTYQCGYTMGIDGPIKWCDWHRGVVVG